MLDVGTDKLLVIAATLWLGVALAALPAPHLDLAMTVVSRETDLQYAAFIQAQYQRSAQQTITSMAR